MSGKEIHSPALISQAIDLLSPVPRWDREWHATAGLSPASREEYPQARVNPIHNNMLLRSRLALSQQPWQHGMERAFT